MKKWILVVVFVTTVGYTANLQADFVIDRLNTGATLIQFGMGTVTQTTNDSAILGGVRDESLTVRPQGGSEFFGILGYNTNGVSVGQSSFDEIYGSLTYDNFSPIDFTQGGNYQFRLTFSSSDLNAEMTDVVTITVQSGATSVSVVTSVPANSGLPRPVFVEFSEFAGIDFTNVDSVQLAFDMAGFAGNDFGMRYFGVTAIPEPTTAWLVLMSIGGWTVRRRSRKIA